MIFQADKKLQDYIACTIDAKEREMAVLEGELSALHSTLAALKQFQEQDAKNFVAGQL